MHLLQPLHPPHSTNSAPVGLARACARQAEARAQAWLAPASDGLRRAFAQAPMVVVCAVGPALEAARMASVCYSAVAQLPVWVLHPDELAAMGAGLWRLAQLLVVSYGEEASADAVTACHSAVQLARDYHCPILALTPDTAAQLPDSGTGIGRAPWRLPTEGQRAASHGAFALPFLGHLALVHAAAQARTPEYVALPAPQAQAVAELAQGLQAYPAWAEAQMAQWAAEGALRALSERCGRATRLRLTTAQWQLLPALRTVAAVKSYVDVGSGYEPTEPCPQGTVQLRISVADQDVRVWADGDGDAQGAVTLRLPIRHEALGGLWAHLVLGLLLPER